MSVKLDVNLDSVKAEPVATRSMFIGAMAKVWQAVKWFFSFCWLFPAEDYVQRPFADVPALKATLSRLPKLHLSPIPE